MVFIRAPRITHTGPNVETLATRDGFPVLVREGHLLAHQARSLMDSEEDDLRHRAAARAPRTIQRPVCEAHHSVSAVTDLELDRRG